MKVRVTRHFMHLIACIMLLLMPLTVWAQTSSSDTLEVEDEDFVRVSLCIASPGRIMYSALGHACLRMECPTHQLDYVFTYEADDVSQQILDFLTGKLKMGMFRVTTDDFLKFYKEEGRGVWAYPLNLPLDMKRELWRVLDERFHTDQDLPYDFTARGCAKVCFECIHQALNGTEMRFTAWPEHLNETRRRIVYKGLSDAPWCRFIAITLGGIEKIKNQQPADKIVIPKDLVAVLQSTEIDNRIVIKDAPVELVKPSATKAEPSLFDWLTPVVLGGILLALSLFNWYLRWFPLNLLLLALQTLAGLVMLYLVGFSGLPNMEWSWLLIPFNPLPALTWRWRKQTYPIVAAIILIWCIAIALYPEHYADWAHILMALAVAVTLWNTASPLEKKQK